MDNKKAEKMKQLNDEENNYKKFGKAIQEIGDSLCETGKKIVIDLRKEEDKEMNTYRIVLRDGSEYFVATDKNIVIDFCCNYYGGEFTVINKELLIRVSEIVSIEKIK